MREGIRSDTSLRCLGAGLHRVAPFTMLAAAVTLFALLPSSQTHAATRNVNVGQNGSGAAAFTFNPAATGAIVGDTVHWSWFSGIHFVSSYVESAPGTPEWENGFSMSGDSLDHVFAAPGVYTYYCKLHASRSAADPSVVDANIAAGVMVGKIVVASTVGGVSESPDTAGLSLGQNRGGSSDWLYYALVSSITGALLAGAVALSLRRRSIRQ